MKVLTEESVPASALENRKSYFSRARISVILYWIVTLPVAFEMTAGGLWDLLQIEYVRVVLKHLGYPQYLLIILGIWKIPSAFALLAPRFGRLKEWAYAGAFFTYTGAAASHLFNGDGTELWMAPVVLAILTFASWALRPPERRLPFAVPSEFDEPRFVAWVAPIVIVLAFLILAYLTLPVGPPPTLPNGA